MAVVKNPTQWISNSGAGYTVPSSSDTITTQSGLVLTTQSGVELQIQPVIHSPKEFTSWTKSSKNISKWTPASGAGYVIDGGNYIIATNSGKYLSTNSGYELITNSTYNVPKTPTVWTASGV